MRRHATDVVAIPGYDPTTEVYLINMASLKRTHKADLNIRGEILGRCASAEMTCSPSLLAKLSAGRELQLESRAPAQRRLHPKAATVHLDDLFGDSKS